MKDLLQIETDSELTLDEANMNYITDIVLKDSGVSIQQLKAKTRIREIAMLRHVAIYFIKLNHTELTLKAIGKHFGCRHHSSIIHAIQAVQDLYDTNKNYRANINKLCIEINPLLMHKLDVK